LKLRHIECFIAKSGAGVIVSPLIYQIAAPVRLLGPVRVLR
jgi:hypothetical protein